jgi:hypothetical protein
MASSPEVGERIELMIGHAWMNRHDMVGHRGPTLAPLHDLTFIAVTTEDGFPR